jgi:hypothetical protein
MPRARSATEAYVGRALGLNPDREDRDVGTAFVVAPLLTPDMRDLIVLFERHEVQYMVVGGFAVNYYGYVRSR